MKYIFILSAIFMLASCQHKSSKEKAKEYWNNNQFELALIEISDAIKEHPDSSSFYTFRAAIYDIMSKYDAEINDLNKIIELNESEKSILFAYHQRAVAKLSLGLLEEALKDVDYFIAHHFHYEVLEGKGKISHKQAVEKAENEYEKYKVRRPPRTITTTGRTWRCSSPTGNCPCARCSSGLPSTSCLSILR